MMLAFAVLVSSAAALEIGLSVTGSGTAQSQLTTSSALATVTDTVIPLAPVSSTSASSTKSSALVASSTVTDGPIYTNFCNSYEGRNCDRLPEQPFWSGILPGQDPFGFTPTAQQNPFSYFLSFTESGQPSTLLETQSLCSVAWETNYTSWLASAPLTYSAFSGGLVPASTATSTLADLTATSVSYGSTTGTATSVIILTDTDSLASTTYTTTYTVTDINYLQSDHTYLSTQTATTETLVYTAYSAYYYPSYSYSVQAPCCSACTIYAGDIEVMYFPPATAVSGNVSSTQVATVTNSAGFVFTSPSVYMALQTLAASDLCGQVGSVITTATTLSFAPSELSTVPAYSQNGSLYSFYSYWSPTDYEPATFGTAPCTDRTTVTAVSEITATVTYNPCYPYISIPPQVQTADPLWSTCTSRWHFLLYDPPYVISTGPGLAAPSFRSFSTTTSVDPTTTPQLETRSSVPSTGPTPGSPTVAPTTSVLVQSASTQSLSQSPAATNTGSGASTSGAVGISSSLGNQVSVGGTTILPASNGATIAVGSGTQALTTTPSTTYVIGSQTLSAGGAPIIVSGTTYSLGSGGSSVVVGGTTLPIGALVGSSTPQYIVASGSQTLKAGASAITVSGTVVSLQGDGSSVVLGGSKTEALSAFLGSTTTAGLGGIIATIGGFGTSTIGSSTSSTKVSTPSSIVTTGSSVKREVGSIWIWGTMLGAGVVVVGWL